MRIFISILYLCRFTNYTCITLCISVFTLLLVKLLIAHSKNLFFVTGPQMAIGTSIVYLPFDAGDGSSIFGNPLNSSVSNVDSSTDVASVISSDGKFNNALRLVGPDSYAVLHITDQAYEWVSLPSYSYSYLPTGYTIAFWIKFTGDGSDVDDCRLLTVVQNNENGITITVENGVRIIIKQKTYSGIYKVKSATGNILSETWYHITATIGSDGLALYVNDHSSGNVHTTNHFSTDRGLFNVYENLDAVFSSMDDNCEVRMDDMLFIDQQVSEGFHKERLGMLNY